MTDVKRLIELAGLNEYTPSDPFIKLDRVADDTLSQYNGINNDEPLEKIVQYHAMKNGVDYEELLHVVDKYRKNPEMLMPGGTVSQMGEGDFTTQPTGTVVNEPMDGMPGELEGLEGPWRMRNGRVVYYDPKEGKYYDRGIDMYLSQEEADALHQGRMAEDHMADPHGGGLTSPPENGVSDEALYKAIEDAKYDAERFDVSVYSNYPEDYEGQLEAIIDDIIGGNASEEVQIINDWYEIMTKSLEPIVAPKLKAHMGIAEESNEMNNNELDEYSKESWTGPLKRKKDNEEDDKKVKEAELNRMRELSGIEIIEQPDETITFSVDSEKGYNAIMDRFNDLISWDGEYMVASEVVFARIEDLFASMGINGPTEAGSEDDGQPDERQEWDDYMGGDDWDHGQYDETVDMERMYEEYQEQLAFEQFQNDLEEAVTFGDDGSRPSPRKTDKQIRPGAMNIAKNVRAGKSMHPMTKIPGEKAWTDPQELGGAIGFKAQVNRGDYVNLLTRDWKRLVKGKDFMYNGQRKVYDLRGDEQIGSETWSDKTHENIIAFMPLTGSDSNYGDFTLVHKDVAPPELIRRGRESGR